MFTNCLPNALISAYPVTFYNNSPSPIKIYWLADHCNKTVDRVSNVCYSNTVYPGDKVTYSFTQLGHFSLGRILGKMLCILPANDKSFYTYYDLLNATCSEIFFAEEPQTLPEEELGEWVLVPKSYPGGCMG